jgi:hypothetical protein
MSLKEFGTMRTFNIVVERDPDTGLYVGYVPGWPDPAFKKWLTDTIFSVTYASDAA